MKNFGKRAKDKITGFEGIITGKADYMYGCSQYLVIPKVDDKGNRVTGEWFDSGRLEINELVVEPESVQAEKPGCETREHPFKQ